MSVSSHSSSEEISNPVQPVRCPDIANKSRTKHSSGIEGTSRHGASHEAKETKGESNSNGGKTSFGSTRGGIDGETVASSLLLALGSVDHSNILVVHSVEGNGEDHVDKDEGKDEFSEESIGKVSILSRSDGNLSSYITLGEGIRESSEEDQGREDGSHKLGSNVHETLGESSLPCNDGSKGDSRIKVSSRNIGKGIDEGNTSKASGKGSNDRVVEGVVKAEEVS